jgi:putative tricarboxylic transport membrane protein
MRRRNIAAAVGLIVCGLVYGYLAWGLPVRSLPNTPGPSFFPLVVTVVILALSTALLIQALAMERDPPASQGDGAASHGRMAGLLLVVILTYIVLLPVLGFILATIPFFAILMVLFGERRPFLVAVGALAMTAVLYGLFRHGFGVFLPRGLLAGIVA